MSLCLIYYGNFFRTEKVKKILNFGGLRIAWKSGNVILVVNTRFLRRYSQVIDNETLR